MGENRPTQEDFLKSEGLRPRESGFAPRIFLPCGFFVLVTPEAYLALPLRMAQRLPIG
jgi:hypothetical protein